MAESTNSDQVQTESKQCRVCLEDQGVVPIFGDEDHPDISIQFATFGSVDVHYDDGFPKLLCKECFVLLDGAVSFRKAAIRSNSILKERKIHANSVSLRPVKTEIENPVENYEAWPQIYIDQKFLKRNRSANQNFAHEIKIEVFNNEVIIGDDGYEPVIAEKEITKVNLKCNICNNFHSTDNLLGHCKLACTSFTSMNENNTKPDIKRRSRVKDQKCEICDLNFTKNMYPKHMLRVHNMKPNIPTKINENNTKPDIKRRSRVKDQKCEICDLNFTKNMYPKHMLKVHNMKPNIGTKTRECPVCKEMCRPDYVKIHMQKVHAMETKPKQKVECPLCKKLFTKRYYRFHIKLHKDKRNYICEICGRDFILRSAFMKHKTIHSNDLPFKCDFCPYRGRNKELLRIHTRSHTRDYPYKCDHCSARCTTKSNLNRHMQQHRDAVDYLCDACNKGFYTKVELERHISARHLGIKSHWCHVCGAGFGYKRGLGKHMRKVHKIAGPGKALYLKLQRDIVLQQESTFK